MKRGKTERLKGLSPEEVKDRKEQREREKKEREDKGAQKAQRVIANLEKQREKEKAEKAEKEKKDRLEFERKMKEKLEKDRLEAEAKVERYKARDLEREESDKMLEKEIEAAKRQRDEGIKVDKERFQQECHDKTKVIRSKMAFRRSDLEELKRSGSKDSKEFERIRKELELHERQHVACEKELQDKVEKSNQKWNANYAARVEAASKRANELYPYSTEEESDYETESESDTGDGNKTMVETEKNLESEKGAEDEYEGIHYMKEKIMEVEEANKPGCSRDGTQAEISIESGGDADKNKELKEFMNLEEPTD